ncbi:B3 domain-containing protein At4g34400-like isoform X2 [Raphanus sativus]|uniref:B3 domain-containing protein At4g34400-like isoform X2 n=1 Tax=Raphanus sativus TaxID=3726 RepID=A0A9W3DHF1_RAPSA|nr:B3 domain-containing protein At4g34400-like isoform X2 [Raphanus sativus]
MYVSVITARESMTRRYIESTFLLKLVFVSSLYVPCFLPSRILSSLSHSLNSSEFKHPLAMAASDSLPRFFKVFISHFSSDSMLIPISYYDELPRHLPKTAILQGTGGCVWKVGMTLKQEEEEVYFEQGWPNFVKDNDLVDGDFMTFVYNGDNVFEVSIYGLDGCKQARAVAELEDDEEKEDSICALSTDDTSAESEEANTVQRSNDKGKAKVGAVEDSDDEEEDSVYSLNNIKDTDTGSSSEFEMANTILRSKNKGKSKEEVIKEESDGKEDSDHSLNSEDEETETGSESKMAKNKGKKKKKVVESSDSDYAEEFGRLDLEEDSSSSDSSYAPDSEDTATHVKRKVKSPKKKGKSKVIKDVVGVGDSSCAVEGVKKEKKTREKVKAIIENPEVYLDDPTNIHFETGVKNRKYELLVHAQLVKDYCLRFKDYISYIDPKGKLEAKTAKWGDQRVCIKKWAKICDRNKLKKQDRVVCELLRKKDLVYAVKIHIIRAKHLV